MDEKSRKSTAKTINILMLGETGVGKSTWMNSFVNFIQHKTLHDAETGHLHTLIPTQFTMMNNDLQQVIVRTGTNENEVQVAGEEATQSATVYCIKFDEINLIDTPGFGDPRGADQDKKNFQNILRTIADFDELHGICIFLKPDNFDTSSLMFPFWIKKLFTYLDKDACRNIVFCFTNTRGTFYKPGDTHPALKKLLSDNHLDIPLRYETIYCFDSEAYRFLAAVKNEPPVRFSPEDRVAFAKSWKNSETETWRMLDWIGRLKPHPIQSPRNLIYVLELVQKLTRPLAEISRNIQTNIAIVDDELKEIQKTSATIENLTRKKMTTRIVIVTEPLPYPNTVCSNPNCCNISSFEEHQTKEYTTICHQNCQLGNHVKWGTVGDPALMNCRAFVSRNVCNCGHRHQEHLHIYYKSKQVAKKVEDEAVKEGLQKHLSAVKLLQLKQKMLNARRNEIWEYENELEEIQRASVKFAYFLKANAITPYNDEMDKFLGHLIKEEREKVAEGGSDKTLQSLEQSRAEYVKQKKEFETRVKDGKGTEHEKKLSHDEVEALVTRLKDLKHAGASLKEALKCVEETGHAVFQESIVTFEPEQQQQQVHVNKTNEKKSLFQTVSTWLCSTNQKESDKMTSGNVSRKQWEIARSQSLRPGLALGSNANIASSSSTLSVQPLTLAATISSPIKNEECRFWPNCRNKERCPYEHPPCQEAFCDEDDCPYPHSSNSSNIESAESQSTEDNGNASGSHRTRGVEERRPENKKPCRFHPNCKKPDCPFDHGDCRYGQYCKSKRCGYTHPWNY